MSALTLSPHPHCETLLQATIWTPVPRLCGHRAVPGPSTRVLVACPRTAPEETLAGFAREDTEVISTGMVATDPA